MICDRHSKYRGFRLPVNGVFIRRVNLPTSLFSPESLNGIHAGGTCSRV